MFAKPTSERLKFLCKPASVEVDGREGVCGAHVGVDALQDDGWCGREGGVQTVSVGAARGREWRERVMRGVLVGSSDVPFTLVTAGWVGCTHNASRRNTATAKRRGDIGLPAIFARKFAADSDYAPQPSA